MVARLRPRSAVNFSPQEDCRFSRPPRCIPQYKGVIQPNR
jgi:hypothetical protein